VCTLEGSSVSFVGAGTCTIDANQDGNADYEPAPEARQSFTIGAGSQSIRFSSNPPASATLRGPPNVVSAIASSGLPVSLSSATPAVCTLEGSSVSFVGAGMCTIDANQDGNADYSAAVQVQQSFPVSKASQLLEFTSSAPGSATVGGPSYAATAIASSGLPVSLSSATPAVCTLEGSSVSFVGAGTCTIDANQDGNAEYGNASEAQQSFVVTKRPQLVIFTSSPPASATLTGSSYTPTASASSQLPVSLVSATPSVCALAGSSVNFVGAGTCAIDAYQPGNAEYAAAPRAQQTFTVGPAPPSAPTSPSALSATLPSLALASTDTAPGPTTTADGELRIIGRSGDTGAITFTVSVDGPGAISWLLTFPNQNSGVVSGGKASCKAGQVKFRNKCHPKTLVFGRGRTAVAAAGTMNFIVKPSASARTTLQNQLRRGRGLRVKAALSFKSSRGGSPVKAVESLTVKLQNTNKHK
jgi:hypothetical protein